MSFEKYNYTLDWEMDTCQADHQNEQNKQLPELTCWWRCSTAHAWRLFGRWPPFLGNGTSGSPASPSSWVTTLGWWWSSSKNWQKDSTWSMFFHTFKGCFQDNLAVSLFKMAAWLCGKSQQSVHTLTSQNIITSACLWCLLEFEKMFILKHALHVRLISMKQGDYQVV